MTTIDLDVWGFAPIAFGSGDEPDPSEIDDTALSEVQIPHTAVNLSWKDWDETTWDRQWLYRTHVFLDREQQDRYFLELDGAHTVVHVWVNGKSAGREISGYLPIRMDITSVVEHGDNRIDVVVDSRWSRIPPMGSPLGPRDLDFFIPGGMHRSARIVSTPATRINDLIVDSEQFSAAGQTIDASVVIDSTDRFAGIDEVRIMVGQNGDIVTSASSPVMPTVSDQSEVTVTLTDTQGLKPWDIEVPNLYDVSAELISSGSVIHRATVRTGFRSVEWRRDGLYLNGRRRALIGFNRHELYPYVGYAACDRAKRADAIRLKRDLNATIVRACHYPQSPAFLDACDEIGLLVIEETPGWQYAGTSQRDPEYPDDPWTEVPEEDRDTEYERLHLDQIRRMVMRDRHRPSVVAWSVFINETRAYTPPLWQRAIDTVRALDGRATIGSSRYRHDGYLNSEFDNAVGRDGSPIWPFDVFGYNDYLVGADGMPRFLDRTPDHPYLITEAVGQFPHFREWFSWDRDGKGQHDQVLYHAAALDHGLNADAACGVIAWVAFDYPAATGAMWGWDGVSADTGGHRLKTSGVGDIFRTLKPGAAIYRAQIDPAERIVIAPAFHWDWHERLQPDGPPVVSAIASNCDELRLWIDGQYSQALTPDRAGYPHTRYPLFFADFSENRGSSRILTIEGIVSGRTVATLRMSADHTADSLVLSADDAAIADDGIDSTLVRFHVADEFGNLRPWANASVHLGVRGPGRLTTENPFTGPGGVGAAWVSSIPDDGSDEDRTITILAEAERYGSTETSIALRKDAGHSPNRC